MRKSHADCVGSLEANTSERLRARRIVLCGAGGAGASEFPVQLYTLTAVAENLVNYNTDDDNQPPNLRLAFPPNPRTEDGFCAVLIVCS